MFGLFKKELNLVAPATGEALDLAAVKDEVFSQRMMGDGMAIMPADGTFVAPADGEITMIFKTGHAYGMKLAKNVEILVHIGINTVEMDGEGFEILAQQGDQVTAGTPIVKVDLDLVKSKGYDIVTPMIITAPETTGEAAGNVTATTSGQVTAGQDVVLTVKA